MTYHEFLNNYMKESSYKVNVIFYLASTYFICSNVKKRQVKQFCDCNTVVKYN